ncbi:MAG TPA: cytochrome ubiquinol oxidase subunit I [Beijerinckiaceae bacterium]|jgi:cytochrome d ubiquinol oxidase subunit I
MTIDAEFLARIQFAFVVAFHILLPAFTVGLASYIAFLEGMRLATGDEKWLAISNFWIRIFSVSFAMGVVSGIVMPFQIGANWSRFSDATGNISGPLLAYEGLTAFFLEAAFLGVLLFGRPLVPRWAHFFAALMVALGTLFSSFWILSFNSWMQTPQGHEIIDGRFFPLSWTQIIFNPSFPYRIAHTVSAFYITTGFVVLGVAAWLMRKGKSPEAARSMFGVTLWFLTIMTPLQIVIGDLHGLNTREHQPAKLAAIEALWETQARAPLTLFAIPDEANERNRFSVEIPVLGSLILGHAADATIQGLKDFPPQDRPPVALPFFGFRLMVGIGMLMLFLVVVANVARWRGVLFESPRLLRVFEFAAPLGFVAVLAGWVVTEVGRQPWTVYGLLRRSESFTPSLTTLDVAISLTAFVVTYLIVYPAGVLVMARMVNQGPAHGAETAPVEGGRPRSPVRAPAEAPVQDREGAR